MLKHHLARLLRKVEIENDEIGARMKPFVRFIDVLYCARSVPDDSQFTTHLMLLKRFNHEPYVCRIVFDKQNFTRILFGLLLSLVSLPGG